MNNKQLLLISIPILTVALLMEKAVDYYTINDINQQIIQKPSSAGTNLKKWKSGQILVKPLAGLSDVEFEKVLKGHNSRSLEKIGTLDVHIVNVPPQAEAAVSQALAKNPQIEFAELDEAVNLSAAIPNDPQFTSAWHLQKIQTPVAWDTSKADGVVIAVLDTGVDATHPDLVNQMLPGWNAVDGGFDTTDINGHGTAVAGTAAAATNNATGVAGIAWNAKILPVRITNSSDGYAYWSDVARGLDWAANHGAKVANISYEVTGSASVGTAAQTMRSKGGLVVVAGGNSGIDPGLVNDPNMISVSATDGADNKASWSNYGAYIDVAAPGVSILTTSRGGVYGNWSGTSFASPATAGVVALIMGANSLLTPDQVETVLENSADKLSTTTPSYFGSGRINAANAVQLALNTVAKDTLSPTVNISSPASGAIISGTTLVDVNATDNSGVSAVSLFANGVLVGTDSTAPYQFSWNSATVKDGTVTLTANATDAAGNKGVSSGVGVTVKNQVTVADINAPSIAIVNPVNGAKISGTVNINVQASDSVGVVKMMLYIDAKLVSSVLNGNSISYNWNTRKIVAGLHAIKAVASDAANNSVEQVIQVSK